MNRCKTQQPVLVAWILHQKIEQSGQNMFAIIQIHSRKIVGIHPTYIAAQNDIAAITAPFRKFYSVIPFINDAHRVSKAVSA